MYLFSFCYLFFSSQTEVRARRGACTACPAPSQPSRLLAVLGWPGCSNFKWTKVYRLKCSMHKYYYIFRAFLLRIRDGSILVLGTGTRVATRYPGTRSGPGYPGIFITRLLSTQHCRLDCEFGVIDNIYHKFTANLLANCKYNCTTHHWLACYGIAYSAYLLISYPRWCATIWRDCVRDANARCIYR